MNRKKFMIGVFGVLFAIALISRIPYSPDSSGAVTLRADITPPPTPAWSVLSGTYSVIEKSLNGGYRVDYDEETKTVSIDVWRYDLTADALNSALLDIENLKAWNKMTDSLKMLELALQQEYIDHDTYGITVVINHINPDDLEQVFATVSKGELLYDIVDETPPGQPIEGTTFNRFISGSSGSGHSIVINTDSKVFHDAGCQYVQKIKSGHIRYFYGTREEAIAEGYTPCQICGG